MRVKVESTGGFAGRDTVVALYDTADLPTGRAGRVREAVGALAAARARGEEGEIGADLPAYRITVEEVEEQDGGDGNGDGDGDGNGDGTGDGDGGAGAGEGVRVYEVRGDPAAAGLASVLGVLLDGPSA
ncbi:MAG: protealysin inhibitor emfourin [Spirillospora sp.]